ncbi:hypothetical protein H5P29_31105 (plasmid) [Aminobacter sp. MDW-2]|uniref:hypothetical protein n=1 Tax=Aminobacter sp. MDW-2 TaxID=2666139 RepID=UPI00163BA376|nr:hypothetical protein [Aminobacter sp. MDW-2]QNH37972.1 hypothetical protein H5P29_31105 [Aminobacter sp. MDW-2]
MTDDDHKPMIELANDGRAALVARICQRRSKLRPRGGVKVGHLASQAGNVGRA